MSFHYTKKNMKMKEIEIWKSIKECTKNKKMLNGVLSLIILIAYKKFILRITIH